MSCKQILTRKIHLLLSGSIEIKANVILSIRVQELIAYNSDKLHVVRVCYSLHGIPLKHRYRIGFSERGKDS